MMNKVISNLLSSNTMSENSTFDISFVNKEQFCVQNDVQV